MTSVVCVAEEDIALDTCKSQGFDNVYYLIDKKDFASVASFFQHIPKIKDETGFQFINFLGQRERTSTYYDFDNLDILHASKELLHTLDSNVPKYFVEREQIKYIDRLTEPHGIINFEVKNYNKSISPLDKHALFSRVKRKERPILIKYLSEFSKDVPELISESLKIKSTESINFITFYGVTHGMITISYFTIFNFSVPNTSLVLKFEKKDNDKHELTIDERKHLESYFCHIDKKFQWQFPDVKSFSWFGYWQYNELAVDNLPNRDFFRRHPELYSIGQIICLSFIGWLILGFISGRHSKFSIYHNILRKNKK